MIYIEKEGLPSSVDEHIIGIRKSEDCRTFFTALLTCLIFAKGWLRRRFYNEIYYFRYSRML